jgi:hypothetical protein
LRLFDDVFLFSCFNLILFFNCFRYLSP